MGRVLLGRAEGTGSPLTDRGKYPFLKVFFVLVLLEAISYSRVTTSSTNFVKQVILLQGCFLPKGLGLCSKP